MGEASRCEVELSKDPLHSKEDIRLVCGATGIKVTNREQLDEAMATLLGGTGPALLCVEQDAELL